jgi:serine/threonine protein kinase/class 3 adenylate cyclase
MTDSPEPRSTTDPVAPSIPLTDQPTTVNQGPKQPDNRLDAAELPRPFGRYTLLRRLGKGGMGTVFLAHDTLLDRPVALKVPHPEVVSAPASLERFYREARAAAQLDHPNICRVHDVGDFEEQPFLTMPYVEGETLSTQIGQYPGQARRIAALVQKLAIALQEAHCRGIVHRDLKPANIMMTSRGEPIIMDFGLARYQGGETTGATSQGVVMGTPSYMSPEQASGNAAAIGPATDIYSLGVILYELLTGRVPFQGPLTAVLVHLVCDPPPLPSMLRDDVDPTLEAICLKTLAKLPADRFASMADLAAALDDYLQGRPVPGITAAPLSPLDSACESALRDLRARGWERGFQHIEDWLPLRSDLSSEEKDALLAWLGGKLQDAEDSRFADVRQQAALKAWAQAGQACRVLRQFNMQRGWQQIDRAASLVTPGDVALEGQLLFLRAFVLSRQGDWDRAVDALHQALEMLGSEHPLTADVLDTLGRVCAGKCNFRSACEFYQQAIASKERAGDEIGLIHSHAELARVYIDWDQLDRAEEQLNAGLKLAQKRGDEVGEALMINHLGRVAYRRGERDADAGRKPAAKKWWKEAGEYFDWALRVYEKHNEAVPEGRARKYAAMLAMHAGDFEQAEKHLARGEQLVRGSGHALGLAEVQEFTSRLRLAQGRRDEAMQLLRQALAGYDELNQPLVATRTQLELARAMAETQTPVRLVVRAYQDALQRAEACRRGDLVAKIEEELHDIDPEVHSRHVFRRVRGHGAPEDTSSLHEGTSESVTILSLELVHFEQFCQGLDPEAVLWTLNQLLAEMEGVLDQHRACVVTYLGGGFLALLREAGHAERAVDAALELRATIAEFNRPRTILGLPLLPARVGIASGLVFLGNIGTYRHLDFTAVGPPVNLAASLMRRADPASPCISQETYEQVRDRFLYRSESPRQLEVVGIGTRQAWDVIERAPRSGIRTGR